MHLSANLPVRGAARKEGRPVAGRSAASRLIAVTLIATTALVSGCASYSRDQVIVGSVPDDYRTRHPIVVTQGEVVEDITVSVAARDLNPRDKGVVEEFAGRFRRSGSATIAMLIPAGSRNEAAARRVAYDIANTLQVKGISERQIVVQHYQAKGYGEAATIRLVFGDLKAKVATPCGQWDEDIVETSENRNYFNFGCATQQNLAAIIENPNDLLRPRGVTAIDPARRSAVIDEWQVDGSRNLPDLFDD